MTDRPNEEREALIADGRDAPLGPEEAAEVGLLAELLADPSTWVEPSADLEDAIVRAVEDADGGAAQVPRPAHSRGWRVAVAGAAAAVVAALVLVGAAVLGDGGTGVDYAADLSGTELAAGAHGAAKITETETGFLVMLDTRGLPSLAPGEFYEAWLRNDAGTLVPIGTFSGVDGMVGLWSGVDPDDFPVLTVTIESADNDQASSGRQVLVGDIRPA